MKISRLNLVCFLSLCTLHLNAQSSSAAQKSKNPYGPDKHITLGKNELLEAGKLSAIYFEKDKPGAAPFLFTKYTVSFFGKGRNPILDIVSYNDTFPAQVFEGIKSSSAGTNVYFEFIKAVKANSEDKTWQKLPSLTVTLTED